MTLCESEGLNVSVEVKVIPCASMHFLHVYYSECYVCVTFVLRCMLHVCYIYVIVCFTYVLNAYYSVCYSLCMCVCYRVFQCVTVCYCVSECVTVCHTPPHI